MESEHRTRPKATPRASSAVGLDDLEYQAVVARAVQPHMARLQLSHPGWLSAVDVATDARDLEQLAALAADAPTEFAAGMISERVANATHGKRR